MHHIPGLVRTARALFSNSPTAHIERLTKRSLLRVSGTDVSSFLQGLITNDMRHLDEGAPAMYCVFLNTKGRVLYDSIIYTSEANSYLLECDTQLINMLQKHLKLYRVRRKINIDVSNLSIWAAYNVENIESKNSNIKLTRDPRLKDLGFRIIAPEQLDVVADLGGCLGKSYEELRYSLGVGEGMQDLPPGNCFPLEMNCDYLHGVSFHKGCYIGQELTARTHHTGVVRKRLMPLQFEPRDDLPEHDAVVTDPGSRNVGKVRSLSKCGCGLGLLRVAEVLKCPESLSVKAMSVRTHRPPWWPAEVSKGRPTA